MKVFLLRKEFAVLLLATGLLSGCTSNEVSKNNVVAQVAIHTQMDSSVMAQLSALDKGSISADQSMLVTVANSKQLQAAISHAKAGQTILLEAGIYTTAHSSAIFKRADGTDDVRDYYFWAKGNGSQDKKITLKSKSSTDQAIISGGHWQNKGYGLFITGKHWVIKNIKVANAAKGIVIDQSEDVLLDNVEVYDIGQEGVHVRDGSSRTIINQLNLHDVGKRNDGFGEGIYIGSDNSVWFEGDGKKTGEKGLKYKKSVNNTVIQNSIIGPNITAEPFDIKEGSYNTLIQHNKIYGAGISGANYADSHIDIKGTDVIVRGNTFYQQGNKKIKRGIMVIDRTKAGSPRELTAQNVYVYDNKFQFDGNTDAFVANRGSSECYAWDNVSSGNLYNSGVSNFIPTGFDYAYGSTYK